MWKNTFSANISKNIRSSVCNSWCYNLNRGGLCWRRRRKYFVEIDSSRRLWHSKSRKGNNIYWRNRQDFKKVRESFNYKGCKWRRCATGFTKIVEGTTASVPPQGGRKHPHQEFLQINTENILFICGGAFEGLEKIVKDRIGKKTIGFGAEIESKKDISKYEVFEKLLPQDLLKFGLIPEFVGRLPIIATLKELDKQALIDIVTKPKNALVKQYQKLFEIDNVQLEFEEDALEQIVEKQ